MTLFALYTKKFILLLILLSSFLSSSLYRPHPVGSQEGSLATGGLPKGQSGMVLTSALQPSSMQFSGTGQLWEGLHWTTLANEVKEAFYF